MSTTEFSRLGHSEDMWSFPSCSKPNNSSILYTIPEAEEECGENQSPIDISTHPSMLDSISDISMPSRSSISADYSDTTFGSLTNNQDTLTSSPRPTTDKGSKKPKSSLRILNINFQSLRKKGKLLECIILDSDPDIIIGTETWLEDSISSSEIFPNELGFDIHRRDRVGDPHGGVLLAAKKHLMLQNIRKSVQTLK